MVAIPLSHDASSLGNNVTDKVVAGHFNSDAMGAKVHFHKTHGARKILYGVP